MQTDAPFREAFALHHDGIYGLLYRIVGVHPEVEDLLQEAFMRLHDHWSEIEPEKRKAWLYQVASRLGLNRLRDERRRERWHREAAMSQQRTDREDACDPAVRLAVQRALTAMPERQARLLMLYSSGLRHDELAAAMEVKKSSLSQLLARAKLAFESEYEDRDTKGSHP